MGLVLAVIHFGTRLPWHWWELLPLIWWIFTILQEVPSKSRKQDVSVAVIQPFLRLGNSSNSYQRETIRTKVFLKSCLKIMLKNMVTKTLPWETGRIFRTTRTRPWIRSLRSQQLNLPSLISNRWLIWRKETLWIWKRGALKRPWSILSFQIMILPFVSYLLYFSLRFSPLWPDRLMLTLKGNCRFMLEAIWMSLRMSEKSQTLPNKPQQFALGTWVWFQSCKILLNSKDFIRKKRLGKLYWGTVTASSIWVEMTRKLSNLWVVF